jgi:hypothetical protein
LEPGLEQRAALCAWCTHSVWGTMLQSVAPCSCEPSVPSKGLSCLGLVSTVASWLVCVGLAGALATAGLGLLMTARCVVGAACAASPCCGPTWWPMTPAGSGRR